MDGWGVAEVLAESHQCGHCEDIILTVGDSILFLFEDVQRATKANCDFFRLMIEKYPAEESIFLRERLTLKICCNEGMYISASWTFRDQPSSPAPVDYPVNTLPVLTPIRKDSSHVRESVARPFNLAPGSHESFATLRRWIRRCREHSGCKGSRHWKLPTRLIDIGGKCGKDVSIYTTNHESPVEYAALSYCWGEDQKSETRRAILQERCRGFPLEELPNTIQDAIVTARRLKLRFLWIDSICIVQNDSVDKERELAIMDQIYSGAFLTIVAARGGKASDGFLQPRNLRECYGAMCRIRYRERAEGEKLLSILAGNPLHITYDEPIDSRGWTFQERLRSSRILRFGIKQTIWDCSRCTKVDGGENYVETVSWSSDEFNESKFTGSPTDRPYPYALDDPIREPQFEEALSIWQNMIEEYSGRTLGVTTDRLPAFAALAQAFGTYLQVGSEQYLAGIWAFDICMQMQWRRSKYTLAHSRCSRIHGPTWSWASSNGAVRFEHPRLLMGVYTLVVNPEECQIEWKSTGFKYGEVLSGRLKVKGFLRQSHLINSKFIGWHHGKRCDIVLPVKAYWDCNEKRDSELWCLEINTHRTESHSYSVGILLARIIDNVYKRVGYFKFDHTELEPEPIEHRVLKEGLPPNSNWLYNGGFQDVHID